MGCQCGAILIATPGRRGAAHFLTSGSNKAVGGGRGGAITAPSGGGVKARTFDVHLRFFCVRMHPGMLGTKRCNQAGELSHLHQEV